MPGVVHTGLMDNKIIEDPFFCLNERNMQWIDKEDWIYQTTSW
jgi:beta-mannosidase